MKRYSLIIIILIVLSAGALFLLLQRTAPKDDDRNVSELAQYSNARYNLSFSYPKTYILSETEAPGSGMREHHIITLMHKEDFPLPIDGEGPPAITIDIYQNNLDGQTTEGWIRNSSASNFKLGEGILSSTTISDLPALSYRWSGLYLGTTIALAQPNWIYAFSVTYFEMGAQIVQDFVVVRDSIEIKSGVDS